MKLLTYSPIITIDYIFNKFTYEKVITGENRYRLDLLKKDKCKIKVIFDTENKTIQVEDKLYKTTILRDYTYKKLQGYNIGLSNFNDFIQHVRESSDIKNVFHHTTQALLLSLSKKKFTYLN
jgi:hypothetical protein